MLLISIVTLLVFTSDNRYSAVSGEFLVNSDFSEGLSGWETRGRASARQVDAGKLTLNLTEPDYRIFVYQKHPLKLKGNKLRVRVRASTINVIPGKKPYHRAVVYVKTKDSAGKKIGNRRIFGLRGTNGWLDLDDVIQINPNFATLIFSLRIVQATGIFIIDSASLIEVEEKGSFKYIFIAFLLCWTVILIWFLLPLIPMIGKSPLNIALVLLLLVIFTAVLLPGEHRTEMSGAIEDSLPFSIGGIQDKIAYSFPGYEWFAERIDINKFGHFVLFTILAFVTFFIQSRSKPFILLVSLPILAIVTEALQVFVDGREPRLFDFFIDITGIGVGIVIALFLALLLRPFSLKNE